MKSAFLKHSDSPLPRPMSRQGWAVLAAVVGVCLILFLLVLRAYNHEGGLRSEGIGAPVKGSGLAIAMTPMAINAEEGTLTTRLNFDPEGLVGLEDADDRLTVNVRVTVTGLDGTHEFRYLVGDELTPQTMVVGITGELANYPFDTYESYLTFTADEVQVSAVGRVTHDKPIRTRVIATGGVMNWNTDLTAPAGYGTRTAASIRFDRVFSTKLFALLMLLLMAVLALVAIEIAMLAVSNRRRAEMGMLSWLAGLLFAFPALRRTMPDAPPIGVTIDILVFLWTLLLSLAGAMLVGLAWGVQSRAALLAQANENPVPSDPTETGSQADGADVPVPD